MIALKRFEFHEKISQKHNLSLHNLLNIFKFFISNCVMLMVEISNGGIDLANRKELIGKK